MTPDLTSTLRQTTLLRFATDEDLDKIVAASRLRTFGRGQVVFTSGDPGDSLIVVIHGHVKVVVRAADGSELTLTVVEPGGAVGDVSIADGGPRSADAETMAPSQLLIIPRELIQDICRRDPAAALALARSVALSLRRLTEAASDLVFLDLPRRLAKVLLAHVTSGAQIGPHFSQEELARQVGGTRQSVNAALAGFQRRGWIEVRGRVITVRQPETLRRFAGS